MATLAVASANISRTRGGLFVLGAGVLWSTIPLGVRLMESATAVQIVFYRAVVQVPLLMAILVIRYRGQIWKALHSVGWNGVWGALALAISYLTGITSLYLTTVGNVVFVFSTAPLMSALIGWIVLRERVNKTTWMAMMLSAVGVLVMTAAATGGGRLAGNLVAAVSALGYAAFTVSLRRGKARDMLPTIALSGVFAAAFAAVASGGLAIPAQDIAISAYLGAVAIGVGLVLYIAGSKALTAAELPLVAMIEIVLAPIWVWFFVSETMSSATFIGGGIVMVAVLLQALLGFRRNQVPIVLTA